MRWKLYVLILGAGVAIGLAGRLLGRLLSIQSGLATVAVLLLASGALSVVIHIQRRYLRKRFAQQPQPMQEMLRKANPEFRYAIAPDASPIGLSAENATRIGTVWINLPVVPWVIAPLGLHEWFGFQSGNFVKLLLLVLGFVCAWSWWSVNVTLWRRWATRRGIDADELQWWGQNANLLWPRGHFFERTELGNVIERLRQR